MNMTKNKFSIYLLGTGVLMAFLAPASFSDMHKTETDINKVQKEMSDVVDTLGNYAYDKKEDALRVVSGSMESIDRQIEVLENRAENGWQELSMDARKQRREMLKTLRQQRNQVAEWYGAMKQSSADAWSDVRKGFSSAYDSLSKAFGKAGKDLMGDKKDSS